MLFATGRIISPGTTSTGGVRPEPELGPAFDAGRASIGPNQSLRVTRVAGGVVFEVVPSADLAAAPDA